MKITKKQKKCSKLWKSMWKLLETGKKIHCGKLFSSVCDTLLQYSTELVIMNKSTKSIIQQLKFEGKEETLLWQKLKTM